MYSSRMEYGGFGLEALLQQMRTGAGSSLAGKRLVSHFLSSSLLDARLDAYWFCFMIRFCCMSDAGASYICSLLLIALAQICRYPVELAKAIFLVQMSDRLPFGIQFLA